MVDNIVTKPLGFILIITAHMVFNVSSLVVVNGTVGNNITLQFTFNVSFTNSSQVGVYKTGDKKIADNRQCKVCFGVYPVNYTVFYHMTNLSLNDSETYWATVFLDKIISKHSNKVNLTVLQQNRCTVPPTLTKNAVSSDNGSSSFSSFHMITVLVVSPVVLLAAVLPVLVYCSIKTKDNQQQQPQLRSNPTVQETFEASSNVRTSSLVYSVLDFPKRTPAVVEINSSDTEYAAVSYLPETRRI